MSVHHLGAAVDLVTGDPELVAGVRELATGAGLSVRSYRQLSMVGATPENLFLLDSRAWDGVTGLTGSSGATVMIAVESGDVAWEKAADCGVGEVVAWPQGIAWLSRRFGEFASEVSPRGTTVVVTGGRGGCGATTLAVALAAAAVAADRSTVLIDADPYGSGLSQALGLSHDQGRSWADFAQVREQLVADDVRDQLADCAGISVLTGPWGSVRGQLDVRRFIQQACERAFDTIIVDLPRYELGSAALPPDVVILPVTTLETGSLVATSALVASELGARCPAVIVRDEGPVPTRVARKALDPKPNHRFRRSRAVPGSADRGMLWKAVARGSVADLASRILTILPERVGLSERQVTEPQVTGEKPGGRRAGGGRTVDGRTVDEQLAVGRRANYAR